MDNAYEFRKSCGRYHRTQKQKRGWLRDPMRRDVEELQREIRNWPECEDHPECPFQCFAVSLIKNKNNSIAYATGDEMFDDLFESHCCGLFERCPQWCPSARHLKSLIATEEQLRQKYNRKRCRLIYKRFRHAWSSRFARVKRSRPWRAFLKCHASNAKYTEHRKVKKCGRAHTKRRCAAKKDASYDLLLEEK